MAFDWQEFLKLAKHLQASPPPGVSEEAARRCAIGRAYYSVFGYTLRYAKDHLGYTSLESSDDHRELRKHLKSHGCWKVADHLNDLRRWRNDCDYDEDVGDLVVMLGSAIDRAERVFKNFVPPATAV
jgi:hypothetical protein